jgi:hypothetical protein
MPLFPYAIIHRALFPYAIIHRALFPSHSSEESVRSLGKGYS